jgi:hypothetical protein
MKKKRHIRPAEDRWPPRPEFTIYDGRGKVLLREFDPSLDLSDTLMLQWPHSSRTVFMGIASHGISWKTWTEPRLQHVERLIKYDINFDGDNVSIIRITRRRWQPCSREFKWKLIIRPM